MLPTATEPRLHPHAAAEQPLVRRSTNIQTWLLRTSPGVCGRTKQGGRNKPIHEKRVCKAGTSGALRLAAQDYRTWSATADACLLACARCSRCRYVSLSIAPYQDCSWFTSCNLSAPLDMVYPASLFRSGYVGYADKKLVLSSTSSQSREARDAREARARARIWRASASSGFCGATAGVGDCERGSRGLLDVPFDAFQRGLTAATVACLASCAECANCAHISLSVAHRDCSCCDAACSSIKSTRHQPLAGMKNGHADCHVGACSLSAVIPPGSPQERTELPSCKMKTNKAARGRG